MVSFGGVVAFLFADLLILPILNIYRRYYGLKMMLVLMGTFYVAMVAAGYLVEALFWVTGLTPQDRSTTMVEVGISWNYTTWLNIVFLLLAVALLVRFVRTGGYSDAKNDGRQPRYLAAAEHEVPLTPVEELTSMNLAPRLGQMTCSETFDPL